MHSIRDRSEYEPQFWGFDTQEEWDACQDQIAREHDEKFHAELLRYVRGEPNDIRPGTIGMLQAEIARRLAQQDPTLLLPANEERFRREIQETYDGEHSVKVTLDPQEIAFARLIVTHEDDLPR